MFSLIPLQYRILAAWLILSLWSGFMVYGGWHECAIRQQAKERKELIAYADEVKKEQARGDKIALDLDMEKTRQKIVYKTITKEIYSHVTSLADSRCIVPAGFVQLHDAAAAGRLPETYVNPVDSPSGIALSAVGETIADNYAICNENRAQLNALIDWENGRH